MMKTKKRYRIILALVLVLLLLSGAFIYYSYFYWVEGKNSSQNYNAANICSLINHYIEDNYQNINSDVVLSSNKKYETNNSGNINIEEILKEYSQKENISLDDGCYYIEIRNKEVYNVIYAKWKYSGFVGTSPVPNPVCKIYSNEADKAYKEFSDYLQQK